MRTRSALVAFVALAAVSQAAACAAAPTAPSTGSPSGTSTTPVASPSLAVSPSPSTSTVLAGPFVVSDVKPSRFLQRVDVGSPDYYVPATQLQPDREARIVGGACAKAPESDELVIERASIGSMYQLDARPGEVAEIVTRYQTGGAAQYLTEISAGVMTCARVDHSPSVWSEYTIVATGFAGDASMLIMQEEFSPPTTASSGHTISYQAVVRGGDAVLILVVSGAESSNAERVHVDRLIKAAVERARD